MQPKPISSTGFPVPIVNLSGYLPCLWKAGAAFPIDRLVAVAVQEDEWVSVHGARCWPDSPFHRVTADGVVDFAQVITPSWWRARRATAADVEALATDAGSEARLSCPEWSITLDDDQRVTLWVIGLPIEEEAAPAWSRRWEGFAEFDGGLC